MAAVSRRAERRAGATFPYVEVDVAVRRFADYYDFRIISVTALITYLSFGVFRTQPQAINRQHFSSTMLLTIIVRPHALSIRLHLRAVPPRSVSTSALCLSLPAAPPLPK